MSFANQLALLTTISIRKSQRGLWHFPRRKLFLGHLLADLAIFLGVFYYFYHSSIRVELILLQLAFIALAVGYLGGRSALFTGTEVPLLLTMPVREIAIFFSRWFEQLITAGRFLVIFGIPATLASFDSWTVLSFIKALFVQVVIILLGTWLGMVLLVSVMRFFRGYRRILGLLLLGLVVLLATYGIRLFDFFSRLASALDYVLTGSHSLALLTLLTIIILVITLPLLRVCYPAAYYLNLGIPRGRSNSFLVWLVKVVLGSKIPGSWGAIVEKELLVFFRQPFTYLRLAFWGLLTVAILLLRLFFANFRNKMGFAGFSLIH